MFFRALFHERVGAFIDDFLAIKRAHGSAVERGIYWPKLMHGLVDRQAKTNRDVPPPPSHLPSHLPALTPASYLEPLRDSACANAHSLTHSLTHPLTHPLTHSPTHPLTHPLTHSLTHSLTQSARHQGQPQRPGVLVRVPVEPALHEQWPQHAHDAGAREQSHHGGREEDERG